MIASTKRGSRTLKRSAEFHHLKALLSLSAKQFQNEAGRAHEEEYDKTKKDVFQRIIRLRCDTENLARCRVDVDFCLESMRIDQVGILKQKSIVRIEEYSMIAQEAALFIGTVGSNIDELDKEQVRCALEQVQLEETITGQMNEDLDAKIQMNESNQEHGQKQLICYWQGPSSIRPITCTSTLQFSSRGKSLRRLKDGTLVQQVIRTCFSYYPFTTIDYCLENIADSKQMADFGDWFNL